MSDPTKVPRLDRMVEFVVDVADAMIEPLEAWLRRRAIQREIVAMRAMTLTGMDCSAWQVLHMDSGERFTTQFAMHVLALKNRGTVEAWLLVNGYEELGADVWRKRPVEEAS